MRIQQLTTDNSAISVDQALTEFMLHQRTSRNSPRTLEYYEWTLARFKAFLTAQGLQNVRTVDSGTLRLFMVSLEETMKPNSVHAIMRAVRALFKFLEREELIARNPMAKVRMPKTDKTILEAFTEKEIDQLLAACDGKDATSLRNRALTMLLLDSGLRLAECASLRVGDVDLQTGTMRIMGKGRKERVSKLGSTALKAFLKYARLRGGNPGEPLWVGKQGTMTACGIAETIENLGKAAGVHAHPHKFRRTCALFMLRNGADVFSVQYLLGHSDLGVMRRYLAQTDRDVTTAHEKYSAMDSMR